MFNSISRLLGAFDDGLITEATLAYRLELLEIRNGIRAIKFAIAVHYG